LVQAENLPTNRKTGRVGFWFSLWKKSEIPERRLFVVERSEIIAVSDKWKPTATVGMLVQKILVSFTVNRSQDIGDPTTRANTRTMCTEMLHRHFIEVMLVN